MKILMVNKFHYIKGGSETYYFSLRRLLQNEGHEIVDFSMKDPQNFNSDYEKYFVENVDYTGTVRIKSKVKMAMNIIYSFEAKRKFEALVQKEKPDLIHLHIFQHQISPSILDVAKKYNIPTVYTAHDLKMICLNYKMMHHGKICEACKNGHYYHCALNKCVKESLSKSCINVMEGYLHKWRKSYDVIDMIVTPSNFYKKKFEEFGVAGERIIHIPNFLERESPIINKGQDSKRYYLYFGRLSEEKGILTLFKAIEGTDFLLYVVGTGPLRQQLQEYVNINKLGNIKLLGFKSGQELTDLVANAKAVILPSEWYENGPYSAIEALQVGRPIIGANIGGIPELVDNNGFLFESGNAQSLRSVLGEMDSCSDEQYEKMEMASKNLFDNTYTAKQHYASLLKVYTCCQQKRRK